MFQNEHNRLTQVRQAFFVRSSVTIRARHFRAKSYEPGPSCSMIAVNSFRMTVFYRNAPIGVTGHYRPLAEKFVAIPSMTVGFCWK